MRIFEYSEFRDHSLAPATSLNRERLGDFSQPQVAGNSFGGDEVSALGGGVLPGLSIGGEWSSEVSALWGGSSRPQPWGDSFRPQFDVLLRSQHWGCSSKAS